MTTIKLIALAFHGHPDENQVAHYDGGGYAPHTVRFISRKEMMQHKRGHFTPLQREHIGRRIRNSSVTYHDMARIYNCSYTTIARIAQEQLQKY